MSIPTTRLGRTGLTVSRLALGTMTFGLQTDETVSHQILDRAAEGGINFLDTADVYPLGGTIETAGRTEEIIGNWLEKQGPSGRRRFVVATKAVNKVGPNSWDQGASRKHLLDAIDLSLKRLKTDHVDLYQLHMDDRETPLEESLEALDVIVKSGRARYIGVSNFLAYRLARALGKSDLHRFTRFVSVQPRYSLLFREIERELLPLASEEGLGVIPYNPLAGGLLTGKYKPGAKPEENTRFTLGTAGGMYQDRYWNERSFNTVTQLHKLTRYVSVQPRYSLLFREIERELLPLAGEEGLGVIPYNPLAGGLLTGKYKPGASPEENTRFTLGTAGNMYQDRYWNERSFNTVTQLHKLADEAGVPLATLAVAWVMANPLITAPLLGASRPEQLDATLAAAEYKLDPALKQKLDELTAEYRKGDAPR